MSYGFFKAAAVSFPVKLGDTMANAERIYEKIKEAESRGAELVVFQELALTGYTCADLFVRESFYKAQLDGLKELLSKTKSSDILVCLGMAIESGGRLFNAAVYMQKGKLLCAIPKTYIPNYNEFYEKRWFTSGKFRNGDTVTVLGEEIPFSENILLRGDGGAVIGTEICEDLWVAEAPSGKLSRSGATVIVNPSASNELIGKKAYRRNLVSMQSARCMAGYVYASAGVGESSTDLVFSGHVMIADNGHMICDDNDTLVCGVIDIERCLNDRKKFNSDAWEVSRKMLEIPFERSKESILPDVVDAYPFVPGDRTDLYSRCSEILGLQARGLMQRINATGIKKVVLGLSGGLDSTLALLVCITAYTKLGLPLTDILCISMPGFGTSERTKLIAADLAKVFGVNFKEIDITKACKQHLKDLEHPEDLYDITYENTQARERTQILFDYANKINGLLIGTGDMSELALGWCTYNGDHMSNYAVNCGVPKTLVKFIIAAYAEEAKKNGKDGIFDTLMRVYELPISPELLPTDEKGEIAQHTEGTIGKYDLHDFFLYHYLRNGFSYDKIFALAKIAFSNVDEEEINRTLDIFYKRFRTQQFKRSCIPDGVKVGSVSVSPRGDLRMPSDISMIY